MNQSYQQQSEYGQYLPPSQTYTPPPQDAGGQSSRYPTYNYDQTQFDQSYSREAQGTNGGGVKKAKLWSLEFMSSKWPRLFMLVVGIQAVLCLTFEAYVFVFPPLLWCFQFPFRDEI